VTGAYLLKPSQLWIWLKLAQPVCSATEKVLLVPVPWYSKAEQKSLSIELIIRR